MTDDIEIGSYADIPCSQCKHFYGHKRASIGHLRQIGATVIVGPRGYDVDKYLQCPTCGALWQSHRDLDPGGRMWSIDPLSPSHKIYRRF